MNDLQIFKHDLFGEIRTAEENGKPLFCGRDVALTLGYKRPNEAIATHCKGAVKRRTPTAGGNQDLLFIPEGDIYRLVARSTLSSAERFESWIFDEVLPTLRQTGTYTAKPAMTQAEILAGLAQVNVNLERKLLAVETRTEELAQKVEAVIQSTPTTSAVSNWKESTDKAILSLCSAHKLNVLKVKGALYKELELVTNCDLNSRKARLQARLVKAGAAKQEWEKISKLEIISRDPKLMNAFDEVFSRLRSKYTN